MRDNILRWCREQALFPGGGPVLLALSGGADSVAALHALLTLQAELGITVEAAHFNHRLRGAESDGDEAFCLNLCAQWGVTIHTGGADVAAFAADRGLGVEEAARLLRYDFLHAALPGAKIATAHNADDNLETLLMHLLRGCGLRGLGGIPPVRGSIVRPLLCVTRADIEAYLLENGLSHREDSSNRSDDYLRNRIRHQALPALRQEAPDLPLRALETALSLRADESFLSAQAAALLESAHTDGGWQVEALRSAPAPLQLRALSQLLREAGGHDVTRAHLEAAQALLYTNNPAAKADFPGLHLRREYGLLTAEPLPAAAHIPSRLVPMPGRLSMPDGQVLVCENGVFTPGQMAYPQEFALNPALLDGLTVRSRRCGDCLRGLGGEKPLKKWLIDCKIPAASRDAVPVLEAAGRVVAVFGVGADPSFRPAPGQSALLFRLEQPQNEV